MFIKFITDQQEALEAIDKQIDNISPFYFKNYNEFKQSLDAMLSERVKLFDEATGH